MLALSILVAMQPAGVATGAGNLAHGTVTDAVSHLPISGATVGAYCEDPWTWIGDVTTAANGTYGPLYSTEGAGMYEVGATAQGYLDSWQFPTWDGVTLLTLDFALSPAETISSGTVTDADTGLPIAGATVWALKNGTSTAGSSSTDSNGHYVVYDSYPEGAGAYTIQSSATHYGASQEATTWDGSTPVTIDLELEWTPTTSVEIEGATRIGTAIAASKDAFFSSEYVVIATGFNWPDALGGSGLAGAYGAPILLTRQDTLPPEVAAEITRLGADDVIVLGGTSAVSANVYNQLDALAGVSVERIAGNNRYETANKVAARTIAVMDGLGWYDGHAFVATGANFPDALGASPLAAWEGWPIYLANPAWGSNAAMVATMDAAGVNEAIVLGGTNVVSPAVESALDAALTSGAERIAGANRYETALRVAEMSVASGLSWDYAAIATGQNFPDALAGGVLQAKYGSVLLLTPGTKLDAGVKTRLTTSRISIHEIHFLGSDAAISPAVRQEVMDALN